MMEYVWNSFRTAFAEQKLEYSPDSETKYFKQASAFLFRFYHDNFRTKYPNRGKKNPEVPKPSVLKATLCNVTSTVIFFSQN